MKVLGIDPGASKTKPGGWAIVDSNGTIVDRDSRENYLRIRETPLDEITVVCLERVSGWTGEDPRRRHNIQKLVTDFGFWQGFLAGLGLPEPHLIVPVVWRRYYGLLGTAKVGGKKQQPSPVIFVNAVWKIDPPLKMKEDGQAVGIILADYGRRFLTP